MKKVALILSGCGVYDGSEIHEVCAALLALHQVGAEVTACAPSGDQRHVINHVSGNPVEGDHREIMEEAARLVRGDIKPLAGLDPSDFDAVVLPGGFGAAKNLCNFATEGDQCTVHTDVRGFLREANNLGKPIGAMCIAPVILAKIFGEDLHPELTIGTDSATAAMMENMGANHVACEAAETVVDERNKMVTTPAYMLAGDIGTVFSGAAGFVNNLMRLCP